MTIMPEPLYAKAKFSHTPDIPMITLSKGKSLVSINSTHEMSAQEKNREAM